MNPTTADEFNAMADALIAKEGYSPPAAFGIGIATVADKDDEVLDTWFASVNAGTNERTAAVLADVLGYSGSPSTVVVTGDHYKALREAFAPFLGLSDHANVAAIEATLAQSATASELPTKKTPVVTFISDLELAPIDIHDAYLRLHLLSHRLVQPHGQSLEGLFGLLTNCVWTTMGPCDVDSFPQAQAAILARGGHVTVNGIDKFPRMVDYVIPKGVRIADASRVRLGAHLAEGSTVMHEGFVNFNAGTLGASMIEGRISAGVIVGENSDIGGGASIMGTLSGGGKETISIGEDCLIGANGGVGISLGDGCVIEAGLYVTAGTRVAIPDGDTVKAATLSGRPGLLYRRNSSTGEVEVLPRQGTWAEGLNAELHSN